MSYDYSMKSCACFKLSRTNHLALIFENMSRKRKREEKKQKKMSERERERARRTQKKQPFPTMPRQLYHIFISFAAFDCLRLIVQLHMPEILHVAIAHTIPNYVYILFQFSLSGFCIHRVLLILICFYTRLRAPYKLRYCLRI